MRPPGNWSQRIWALVVAAMLLAPASQGGEVYKWRDADGRLHFGDRPPTDQAHEIVDIKSEPSAQTDELVERLERQKRYKDALKQERGEREKRAVEKAQAEAERAARCEEARAYLSRIENARSLYREQDDGRQTTLGFDEREKHEAEAREAVKEHCG